MSVIIKAENISKKYLLVHEQQPRYKSLRETISTKATNIFSKRKKLQHEPFWALNGLNFQISRGERIGIIGRNGAGKSTLLKILSRITEPTTGKITINGRVASLLEVGTGFHPELTGRENIFLNGSILGMSRSEIKQKFEEIVAFAEIEKFLDTPVKRYSSGMYVRLAFSVAAHLEPEILIVDEVLAVGDAQFQKKCIGKMQDVAGSGRTILFVSHNMAAVQNLCSKIIWLDKGKIVQQGPVAETISSYLESSPENDSILIADRTDRSGNGLIRFTGVEFRNKSGKLQSSLQCGASNKLSLLVKTKQASLRNLQLSVGIDDEFGQRISLLSNEVTGQQLALTDIGNYRIDISLEKVPLKSGKYAFTLFASVNGDVADWLQQAGTFFVENGDYFDSGKLPPSGQGSFFIGHSFELNKE